MRRFLTLTLAAAALTTAAAHADTPAECAEALYCCSDDACDTILDDCLDATADAATLARRMRRIANALSTLEEEGEYVCPSDGWDIDDGGAF